MGRDAWLSWTMAPRSTPLHQGSLKITLWMSGLSQMLWADESSAQAWETPSLILLAMSSYGFKSGVWSLGLWWWSNRPVVPDLSDFMAWVPITLGTPTIGCIVNVIREKEIDALVTPLINTCVAYLLAVWQVTPHVRRWQGCYQSAGFHWIQWRSHHQG